MKTYILTESRKDFLTDINTSMLLEAYPFQLIQAVSLQDAAMQLTKNPSAILIISEAVLDGADKSSIPAKAFGYATTPSGNETLQSFGIASIGLCRTSGALLDALSNEPLKALNASSPKTIQTAATNAQAPRQETAIVQSTKQKATEKKDNPIPTQKPVPAKNPSAPIAQPNESNSQPTLTAAPAQPVGGPMQFTPEMMMQMMQMFQQMQNGQTVSSTPATPEVESSINEELGPEKETAAEENEDTPASESEEMTEVIEEYEPETQDQPHEEEPPTTETTGTAMRERKRKKTAQQIDADIEEDLLAKSLAEHRKTVVASVYAAKGGVGKTSISTELAVCLALTSNGRRRFRVCILDYNIDFGDVATTLELKDSGPNMSYWAAEIREMIERGQSPDEIQFTKQQMEDRYLQCMDKTGLFALCAPITHEDSMLIKPIELEVMLRNIVENGEFDYVICDTGNNTRDSSIIAIDHSDFIFLVATQDITTANCNASVLRTLEDSGFDIDKVRLIINNIMPSRETGISVQEVEETFPYKCICRIKRTPDIIRANNLSQPLVYKPNHEYTKQIQRLVRFITAGEIQEEAPKRGWARLFGR